MTATPRPAVLIIIGVTGDLSRRYLLPAIEQIAAAGALPSRFHVLGTTRRTTSHKTLVRELFGPESYLAEHFEVVQLDVTDRASYVALKDRLDRIDKTLTEPAQRLFYLSVPPQVSWPVIEMLGEVGLNDRTTVKLLLEKPFGTDLASADNLLSHIDRHFDETQIYRIDHYLAKEMAQNLLVFRQSNPLLGHTWHGEFVERIDIRISESIDIEGRGNFYEQTGALRDVMQSHGLQLAALTLMKAQDGPLSDVPARRVEALKSLHLTESSLDDMAVRGQYIGYRAETDNPASTTETYVAITLRSSDPLWHNVPIRIATGKALPTKETSVCLTYRSATGQQPNRLTLRIQPDAGIELELWSKAPGYERRLEQHRLRFHYHERYQSLPDAYEQVLLDAIRSDHTLFTSGDEVRESWRILDQLQKAWSFRVDDLIFYEKGSDPLREAEHHSQQAEP